MKLRIYKHPSLTVIPWVVQYGDINVNQLPTWREAMDDVPACIDWLIQIGEVQP